MIIRLIAFFALLLNVACTAALATTLLNDPNDAAAPQLRALGVDTSNAGLLAVLYDEQAEPKIRYLAATAMGQSGEDGALTVLVSLLNHAHESLRAGAMNGLLYLNDPMSVPYISAALSEDSSETVQQLAITALYLLRTDSAVAALDQYVSSVKGDQKTRASALGALSEIGSNQSINTFTLLLEDPDPVVRAKSSLTLSRKYNIYNLEMLVDVASDPGIPIWLWHDAVEELERKSGRKFLPPTEQSKKLVPKQREKLQEDIQTWWTAGGAREEQ